MLTISQSPMPPEIRKQLATVMEGLRRCLDVLGDPTFSNEQMKRELISAILLPCFKPNTQIRIERKLYGTLGLGPVDYVITCDLLEIIVTEAKKRDLEIAIFQNVGELEAAQKVLDAWFFSNHSSHAV